MATIRPADFAQATDLAAYHAVLSELHREVWPDNPPRSREAWWATVVRHKPSGELAGFADVTILPSDRSVIYQGDTGVWHKYRGRGLGRWIKAANILRVLPRIPEAKWVETGNAGSNRPMLAINEAMGFYPYKEIIGWQLDLEALHGRVRREPAA